MKNRLISLKRRGVWGVRCLVSCAIGQRMAKTALIIFALLPLFSFAYTLDEIKSRVRGAYLYYYDSSGSLKYQTYYGHYDDVVSAFKSNWLAIETNGHSLGQPDIDDIAYNSTNSSSSANITRSVFDLTDKYYRVSSFSDIVILYKFAQSLYLSGYRGSGFSDPIPVSGSNVSRFNFNYLVLCSDILSSTNSVFRQILLNHLSTIQTSVQNIELNVTGLQNAVEQGNNILSNLNVSSSSLSSTASTIRDDILRDVSDPLKAFRSYYWDTHPELDLFDQSRLATINPLPPNNQITLEETPGGPATSRASQQSAALAELARDDVKNVVDAVRDPESRYYQDNVDSLLNSRGALADISSNNNVTRSFTTNNVVRPFTNSVHDAAHDVNTNAQQIAKDTWDKFDEAFRNGINARVIYPMHGSDVEAVNVRDSALDEFAGTFAQWGGVMSNSLDQLLLALQDVDLDLQPWYDRWDDWVGNEKFSEYAPFMKEYIENIHSNQYLLFSQYRDFVNDGGAFWNTLHANMPSILSKYGFDSSEFGDHNWWHFISASSVASAEFVSFIFDNYALVTNLSSEASAFHDDNGSSFDFIEGARRVVSSIPSKSAILDQVGQYTNAVDVSFIGTATNFLSSCSNRVDRGLSVFDSSDSLPSNLQFWRGTSSRSRASSFDILHSGINVDLSNLQRPIGLLRVGVAFAYSLFFLFLLPKYCLFWVRRFYNVIMSVFGTFHYGV